MRGTFSWGVKDPHRRPPWVGAGNGLLHGNPVRWLGPEVRPEGRSKPETPDGALQV